MKKLLAILLATLFVFSLAGCGDKAPSTDIKDPVELLQNVWDKFGDDERFAVVGGDFSEENNKMDMPGVFAITDAEAIDSTLAFPAASIDKIDSAASLVHMMNANTFTCGAYHVVDYNNNETLISEIKANIDNRRWMCGFPEKLVIATVDDLYVVAFYGNEQIVTNFSTHLTEAYPQAKIVVDQAITA